MNYDSMRLEISYKKITAKIYMKAKNTLLKTHGH